MTPNNFEKQVKDKLSSRQIQPSSDAWLKLEDSINSKSKNNQIVYWKITAILALTISGILFLYIGIYSDTNNSTTPIVISQPKQSTNNNIKQPIENKEEINQLNSTHSVVTTTKLATSNRSTKLTSSSTKTTTRNKNKVKNRTFIKKNSQKLPVVKEVITSTIDNNTNILKNNSYKKNLNSHQDIFLAINNSVKENLLKSSKNKNYVNPHKLLEQVDKTRNISTKIKVIRFLDKTEKSPVVSNIINKIK